MKFGQLKEKITKESLPVRTDLSNEFTSVILGIYQRKTYPS